MRFTRLHFLTLSAVLLTVLVSPLAAQTGPGGVGNPTGAGGQPRNILWLRADVGVAPGTNGVGVSAWNDQSGNANHFGQATGANQPIFTTGLVNGRPVLRFDATNDFISALGAGLNTASAIPFTFFAVTNSSAAQTNPRGLFDSAPNTNNVFRFFGNNAVELWNGSPSLAYTLTGSAPTIVTALADLNGSNRRLTTFKDGIQTASTTPANTTAVVFTNPQFGRINNGGGTGQFSGDIAESIIFNGVALNTAQRLVVENHLGAKYGRSLGANDYFSNANTNGATGFNYDVIGIMGLNTGEKQSSSSNGFITITENGSSLTTVGTPVGTFIGHNNTPIAQQTNNMASTGFTYNAGRDFWLESTGSHTYTITFDFAALGYTTCPPSNNPNDYGYIARLAQGSDYFNLPINGTPLINGTKVTINYTTGGGVGFINIGYNAVATAATTVYSVNTTCPGGCDWENVASWTTNASGVPSATPLICPTTNRVVLTGHTVTINTNGAVSPSVTINTGGRLNLGITTGHTFTTLAGAGLLSLASNTYPTITTNTHITTAGSTIEFTGATNYTIPAPPNAAAAFRNLVITGGGSSIKTLSGNRTVNETLNIANLTSLEVAANNLTVVGATNIDGSLMDNNATGTTSLQNVTMNGGVIDGAAIGVFTMSGTLNFVTGTNTIGQGTITVTGVTTLPTGVTTNFTSLNGNKTFTGATTISGNWNNTGNQAFFFGNSFTVNSSAILNAGTACNYNFTGTGNLDGTMATYTLPIMNVTGTYTNSIPQLLVTGDITIGAGGKLINVSTIVPPYFMGFNIARPALPRMDAIGVSNDVGNSFINLTTNAGNAIRLTRAAGTLYTVRHTDLQTNATPSTAQAIMVHFSLGSSSNGGALVDVGRLVVGSGFADDNTIPLDANTTASLTINHETGNSSSLTANGANLGLRNNANYLWVINPTTSDISYRSPSSNAATTVLAGTMDVWDGFIILADNAPLTTTGLTPTDFKFIMNNGVGNLNLNYLRIVPITTPIIGPVATIYCTSLTAPSATFNVSYSLPVSASADTHFNTGNEVVVQLSNSVGAFVAPENIGTLATTATSGTIVCAIPANRQGAGYRMRIATREPNVNSGFVGADNGMPITINGYRTSPTLTQTLPVGGTGNLLSVTSLTGGAPNPVPTAYQWAYTVSGSTVVNNIAGATAATYTPAPPLTSVSNTYRVFCIITSACGSSFSDGIQVSVNCSVTTNLVTNPNFSLITAPYSGVAPVNHKDTGIGFASQYGLPSGVPPGSGTGTGIPVANVIDCSSNGRETCTMFPETTFTVGLNPRNVHTNFCDLRTTFHLDGTTARIGNVTATNNGSTTVTGTGTNFVASSVGSVITMDYTIQRDYGTLSYTNGSGTVTRVGGSNFPADVDIVGAYLVIDGIVSGRVTARTDDATLTISNTTGTTGSRTSGAYRFNYSNERVITAHTSATEFTVTPAFGTLDEFFCNNQTTRNYRYIHGSRIVGGSGGYCLTANAATNGSINVWQQNIAVTPNKNYVFSFNAVNLNSGSALQFATFFDCYQIGTNVDNPAPELCRWARYSVQWNSGSKSTVSVAIRNIAVFAAGNDMTIDDIQFYECTDSVNYPAGEVFIWRGITNNWFNGDNWGTCAPPTCADDVIIPVVPFGRFYPVINAVGATARDIQLDVNASLTMNAGFNIDVCGNFNNQGTTVLNPTSTVTFVSDTRNPQLVTGTWTGTNRFANLVVNKASAAGVLRFDTDINILRSFTITTGTVNGNSRQITVGRDFTNAINGTFNANNSTVTFDGGNAANNGSLNQIFTNSGAAAACQFYNAIINQSSTSTVFLNNDFIVNNVLTLTRGRFVRSGAAGSRYVNVTNNAAASIVGHNTNSYIATIPFTTDRLILRRAIANLARTYDFPVGDAVNYQNSRLEITSALGAGVTTMDAFFTTTDAAGTLGVGCTYTPCTGGYWSITPNTPATGTALYNMELFPVGFGCAPATACAPEVITIAKGTFPTTWALAGSSYTTTYKRSGFSSFTDFVPMGGITILPVSFLRFNAVAKGNTAELAWATSMEKNNKLFHIQRSTNGVDFETIGTTNGVGTTSQLAEYSFTDKNPKAGTNYYRLEQIDLDGKTSYSKIEALSFDNKQLGELTVYPNPVDGNLLNVIVPVSSGEEVILTLSDILGKIVYQNTITYKGQAWVINANFPTGVYVLTVATANKIYHEKVRYLHK